DGCLCPSASAPALRSLPVRLPVDSIENLLRALAQQIFSNRNAQLFRLRFGTTCFGGQQTLAVRIADQPTQPDFSIGALGVAGNRRRTTAIQMAVQRTLCTYPQRAVEIVQRRQQGVQLGIFASAFDAHRTLTTRRQAQLRRQAAADTLVKAQTL